VSAEVVTIDELAEELYMVQTLPAALNTAMLQFELDEHADRQSAEVGTVVELSVADVLLLTSIEFLLL
jgi:hypothetical protein